MTCWPAGPGLHPGPHPAAASLCAGGPAGHGVRPEAARQPARRRPGRAAAARRRGHGPAARSRRPGPGRGPAEPVHRDHRGASLSLVEDAGPGDAGTADTGTAGSTGGDSQAGDSGTGGTPLPVRDGQAGITVPAAGTVTLALSVPGQAALPPSASAAAPEPAQPVFTRYWLHGKGPAPAGNLPVAVHLSPARVALPQAAGAQDAAAVRLTVACGPEPAAGAVDLDVPARAGGHARTARCATTCPPCGHARWDLAVRGAAGAPPGQYFLAARIRDQLGQVLEDATAVTLGGPPVPGPACLRTARPRTPCPATSCWLRWMRTCRPSRPSSRSPCSRRPSGSGPGPPGNWRSGWPTGPRPRSAARPS